jgi:hypothetical protein
VFSLHVNAVFKEALLKMKVFPSSILFQEVLLGIWRNLKRRVKITVIKDTSGSSAYLLWNVTFNFY